MADQVPKAVVQERYERLVALQEQISWTENQAFVGRTVEVLVAAGEGRKDGATHRLSGRAADNRLVHFAVPAGDRPQPRPGDLVSVKVTHAAPHHLIADAVLDGGPFAWRTTRAGDLWQQRAEAAAASAAAAAAEAAASERAASGTAASGTAGAGSGVGAPGPRPVALGLPTFRRD